jgi:hypothetical protein
MSQPIERMESTPKAWCGRSWGGLVDRRSEAFAQALALKGAGEADPFAVVDSFLAFFDATGVPLMRDEEEWIFRAIRPTPPAVIKALEEHIAISSLVYALVKEAEAGCVDLRVTGELGELLESHLLMEEEEIRPLIARRPSLIGMP